MAGQEVENKQKSKRGRNPWIAVGIFLGEAIYFAFNPDSWVYLCPANTLFVAILALNVHYSNKPGQYFTRVDINDGSSLINPDLSKYDPSLFFPASKPRSKQVVIEEPVKLVKEVRPSVVNTPVKPKIKVTPVVTIEKNGMMYVYSNKAHRYVPASTFNPEDNE